MSTTALGTEGHSKRSGEARSVRVYFWAANALVIGLLVFGVTEGDVGGGVAVGTLIAWGLILIVALIQPGGGVGLAAKVSLAVAGVAALETFVFSPRILGRMMEIHPVLIIAILPLAQYFFGIWGLILATPVAVYVIRELILRESTD